MINKTNCPNCGAPITGEKCNYCGSLFLDFAVIDADTPFYIKFKHNNKIMRAKCILKEYKINNVCDRPILYSDNAECITLRSRNNMTIETTFRVLDDNGILSLFVDTDELPDGVQPW